MIKKFLIFLLVLIFLFPIMVFAEENYQLQVVKDSSEMKYLEKNQGYISKKIVTSDTENGEVIVELTLSNTAKKGVISGNVSSDSEIVLIIDESGSMDTDLVIDNVETDRYTVVMNAAKELVSKIFDYSPDVKIGLVFFGTNASVQSQLSNDKNALLETLSNGPYESGMTYTADALNAAQSVFSDSDNGKIIVLLTDGVPSQTTETKDKLIELANNNYHIITMLTGVEHYTESVFGPIETPTAGKLYVITDSDITNIIENDIYSDVVDLIQKNNPIKNIVIEDFFPTDVIQHFDFSYVDVPTVGTISQNIENDKIIFSLDNLDGNKEVKISYKLKLKNMNDKTLLDKVIKTNEKVVLTYKDVDDASYTVVLDSSPSIRLVDVSKFTNPDTGLKGLSVIICFSIILFGTISLVKRKRIV